MDYQNVFSRNEKTGKMIIEVALDAYLDFYHEWDNAKYRKRDINPELTDFLEECVGQIANKEALEIWFNIEDGERNELKEREIQESFHHYFNYGVSSIKAIIKNLYKAVFGSFLVSLVMLVFLFFVPESYEHNIAAYTLINGLEIGAWVFMWQAFHAIGFERMDEKKKIKEYKRLLAADIHFTYHS